MSTPRELLGIRDDLAQKVAERQIDRADAVADLKAAAGRHPELLDKLADDWADTEIDRGVRKYAARRDKTANAAITRKLAELGMERPTLDGDVVPIGDDDPSYRVTLATYGDYVTVNLASSRRLVKSFEVREEDHEVLKAAAGGKVSVTREQALDALKRLPEGKRRMLRMQIRARLATERIEAFERRYDAYGQAAEG
ncbi:MAG: hypothetical protein ACRDVE_15285 [Actinocrinis sp.]